jgi:ribose transport system permease protein
MTSTKSLSVFVGRYGVIGALIALIIFGALRYDNFLGAFNILSFVRYNSMFALVSLGMAFVIMTGGIDLSVGAVAALGSVVSAIVSPHGMVAGLLAGAGVGILAGLLNGLMVTRLKVFPFIATLAMMLAAKGTALLIAGNQSVDVDYDSTFTVLGQGDLLGLPIPAWIAFLCFIAGSILLNFTEIGRTVLAIGGNEDATRLMGLPIDRVKLMVYAASGTLAAVAGVTLASQFGAGQPIEGQGWELFAIAAVVVGGTSLMGGKGSIGTTLAGVALLGLIFNILNFENGLGWISLSAYWQSVVRGVFLLIVVVLQTRLSARDAQERLG